MRFQYSTLTSPNPFPQPLISRFSVHHAAIHESAETLTRDSYPAPDSGTGTHSGRHLCYPALPCRENPRQSREASSVYLCCIPPLARA